MEKKTWYKKEVTCNVCEKDVGETFVDGKSKVGPWMVMCMPCWRWCGKGKLGLGLGQRYQKLNGEYVKVEG